MSDPGLNYPVMALSRDTSILTVQDWPNLTACSPHAFRRGYFTDLQVIDASLRSFNVNDARMLGRWKALKVVIGFFSTYQVRVDLSFTQPTQLTLEQAKDAVIRAVSRNHSFWSEYGSVARFKVRLHKASTFDELASAFAAT